MHGLRAKPPEQNNHRPPRIYLAARRAELRLPTVLAVALMSIRCVSRAYAKFVLCLPLPLPFAPPREAFLGRLFGWGPENCVSGAYARHMMYIRKKGDGDDERERGGVEARPVIRLAYAKHLLSKALPFAFVQMGWLQEADFWSAYARGMPCLTRGVPKTASCCQQTERWSWMRRERRAQIWHMSELCWTFFFVKAWRDHAWYNKYIYIIDKW